MSDPCPAPESDDRPLRPALALAMRGRCPACGEGRLFARFLKPVHACARCGQRWDGHQADDFPAYIVILLLGHLLIPLMIEVNAALAIPLGWQAVLWPGLAVLLGGLMIQPAKGAVLALQWARQMHGFT